MLVKQKENAPTISSSFLGCGGTVPGWDRFRLGQFPAVDLFQIVTFQTNVEEFMFADPSNINQSNQFLPFMLLSAISTFSCTWCFLMNEALLGNDVQLNLIFEDVHEDVNLFFNPGSGIGVYNGRSSNELNAVRIICVPSTAKTIQPRHEAMLHTRC